MKIIRFMLMFLTVAALLFLLSNPVVAGANDESLKVSKTGRVNYKTMHNVGNSTIPAGAYTVKHRVHDSGDHYVHFKPIGKPGQEIVAAVRCEPLPSGENILKTTRTDTVTESGVRRIHRLTVQGNNAAFVF